MDHQYRPNNLKRLYGAQHYTYGYKVQLLLRALGRLGRCQGVQSHKKGHLCPKTGFSPLAPTSAWSCPQLAKFIFPLVYMVNPMCLLWDNSYFRVCCITPFTTFQCEESIPSAPKSGPGIHPMHIKLRLYHLIGTLYMLGWVRMPESGVVVQVARTFPKTVSAILGAILWLPQAIFIAPIFLSLVRHGGRVV
ncbi:hypothetical protein FRACYDRAFT_240633 [Fragilariopsis cylindrus CCMP1102]|uniref:Uncharacterized protein n=1 Tax=Fragilariopsis cylindrus CCMP1102 TaxID=635003 RepID=A0A1E7FCP5_9STRA|nr:hypothetical protein FRACYDRAFT_240633 [Fragilariopsis cylindrus CCMP1102]|eukprot:OEU15937.1 hypothetical protein FRACYDRAFT_240633 [Fragilariopsis cylindrus CCMP1102]